MFSYIIISDINRMREDGSCVPAFSQSKSLKYQYDFWFWQGMIMCFYESRYMDK
jgi:hypothetical protein